MSLLNDEFDSISNTITSLYDGLNSNTVIEEGENKGFSLSCSICSKIPRFIADFEKNYFFTFCDNQHKIESISFDFFLENSTKDLNNVLCYNCQKSEKDLSKLFQCTKCYLFFCSNCKSKHTEENSHNNFISGDKMNTYCSQHNEPYKYYNNIKKKHLCQKCFDYEINNSEYNKNNNIIELSKHIKFKETIDEYLRRSKENIKMYNNISMTINEWIKNLTNKFNTLLYSLKNYCLMQYKIVSSLSFENNYEKYLNNFNVYFNYEIINNEKIDKFIKNLNNQINSNYNRNEDICTVSKFFIDLLNSLGKKQINIESKKNLIVKEKKISPLYTDKIIEDTNKLKVENMEKKKYVIKKKVTTFTPFNEDKYLLIGLETGKIRIYKEILNEKNEKGEEINDYLKKILTIKEFYNEINNICELDSDKIVASDIKNKIKIIQTKDDLKSYSVIQELYLKEDSGNINTISYLPIFSYYRNRHHFCIGDNNHILIYKSNKAPLNLKPPALGYHSKIEEYTIVQPTFILDDHNLSVIKDINQKNDHSKEPLAFNLEEDLELKITTNCIAEIDEKYMAVTCPKANCVKIYNMQNKFKEVYNIPNIFSSEGNCTLAVSKNREKLFVACVKGFCIVSLVNINKIIKFHLNQKILCINFFSPECVVTATLKNEDNYIKQYKSTNEFKEISKFSESKTYSQFEINNLKVIKNKIYYLDNTNFIHYYKSTQ